MAVFRGKDRTRSRPAAMTREGYQAFERARHRLAKYVGRPATMISDADTIEYLSRGDVNTIAYLKETRQFVE